MKIFLSYNSKDYELAKEIKELLENCGLNVFLAHTSIEPIKSWQDEIHRSLKECDVFIPLLTKNFKDSKWTDQESGIAFNEGKKILSLKIDTDPYGFLGQFQALNFNIKDTLPDLTKLEKKLEIIEKLMKFFPEDIRESFISSLGKTNCYRLGTAKCRFIKRLEKLEPFNKKEINELTKGIANNSQLYLAHEVKPYLRELMEKYNKEIDPIIKEEIIDALEPQRVIEREQRKMLGGESEAGFPSLYGTPEQKLKQLEGYGGKRIEEIREELIKEIEKEKDPSLVDGLKKHL